MQYKNPYPHNKEISKFLNTIDWTQAYKQSVGPKINKIIALRSKSPKKYQKYFDSVIYNLKIIGNNSPYSHIRINRRDHIMSDHAFCRVLELVEEVDMIDLKNKALKALEESDYKPVYGDGNRIIATIVKK